jgi:hypothetical protein
MLCPLATLVALALAARGGDVRTSPTSTSASVSLSEAGSGAVCGRALSAADDDGFEGPALDPRLAPGFVAAPLGPEVVALRASPATCAVACAMVFSRAVTPRLSGAAPPFESLLFAAACCCGATVALPCPASRDGLL